MRCVGATMTPPDLDRVLSFVRGRRPSMTGRVERVMRDLAFLSCGRMVGPTVVAEDDSVALVWSTPTRSLSLEVEDDGAWWAYSDDEHGGHGGGEDLGGIGPILARFYDEVHHDAA